MIQQNQLASVSLSATATIPELQQSKTAVLNTLASRHSRRSFVYAIERFIAWCCREPSPSWGCSWNRGQPSRIQGAPETAQRHANCYSEQWRKRLL